MRFTHKCYTATSMLNDLNRLKDFRLNMSQQESRNDYGKGYDKGFADACLVAMRLFKGYLASEAGNDIYG